MCARVCAHACVRVIRKIKLPFEDNATSLYQLYLIYALNLVIFCHVGLCFCFNMRR